MKSEDLMNKEYSCPSCHQRMQDDSFTLHEDLGYHSCHGCSIIYDDLNKKIWVGDKFQFIGKSYEDCCKAVKMLVFS